MEAIVLAGGFGTRLQSVVSDVPKPMAEVQGKPFLEHILLYLQTNGITRVILSVGYKHEVIKDYFNDSFAGMTLDYVVEDEPLGTGGAILKAWPSLKTDHVFVINGDTFFNVDLKSLFASHIKHHSDLTLSLKPMQEFDRYGSVAIDADSKVIDFKEKEFVAKGNINGGIYLLNKNIFAPFKLAQQFSFEEFMQENISTLNIYADIFDHYFIDIGIPEDYQRAQTELVQHL
ncbi:MAG: D-glycero-alpha-D-manno-heptose 1-phosphate guanylyltransferase [Methyloprofundus sp.]|nr:MAG: D-glycero-alpha-D-manno-heptose 1-phosphate guanylyltransferase [Methyloprofundus sp.]